MLRATEGSTSFIVLNGCEVGGDGHLPHFISMDGEGDGMATSSIDIIVLGGATSSILFKGEGGK